MRQSFFPCTERCLTSFSVLSFTVAKMKLLMLILVLSFASNLHAYHIPVLGLSNRLVLIHLFNRPDWSPVILDTGAIWQVIS